jgi:hypothetical protein
LTWTEIDSAATSPAETDIPFFYSIWVTATAYAVAAVRVPTSGNGFRYTVQSIAGSGTSGATEPTWPTKVGVTVVDNAGANQITWICTGPDDSFVGRVVRNCNNLPTQHPHYSSVQTYINEAKDELLTLGLTLSGRRVLDWLPRLRNWRWYDVTINNQAYLPLPERMLYLEDVHYTKLTTAVVDGTTVEYLSVEEPDAELWGLISMAAGWPTRWRRAGSRVLLKPLPTTTYLTMVVLYGTRRENDLVAAGDTLLMDPQLQTLAVELATAITMEKMGWADAAARRASVVSRLTTMMNIRVEEGKRNTIVTTIAGTPR